jgi:NADH dehydrogenase
VKNPIGKIVIIGGGFAGLAAAECLSWQQHSHEVTLVDSRETSQFLPLLPDIVGHSLPPDIPGYPLKRAAQRWDFHFQHARVTSLDLLQKCVVTDKGNIPYDGLLIASGTETSFKACETWSKRPLSVDSVDDAVKLRDMAAKDESCHYIVCGGGYTGVELASNLRYFFRQRKSQNQVTIVEHGHHLCGALPRKQVDFIEKAVRQAGIEVKVDTTITELDQDHVRLADGTVISNARVIWAAGVCTAPFVNDLSFSKNRQGRLAVDSFLALDNGIFAAGDAGGFKAGNGELRMSVQFALTQGWHAADNILRYLAGHALRPYRPLDPGWVVPLANGRGCGTILGLEIYGRLPYVLHTLVCMARSVGLTNRLQLARHYWKQGFSGKQ